MYAHKVKKLAKHISRIEIVCKLLHILNDRLLLKLYDL